MPQNNAEGGIEEAMRRLKVQDDQEAVDGRQIPYPDRPGEPDCIHYLRTGLCGYGSKCRYNHPTYIGKGTQYSGELPERVGQPDCQYFLKTGTCKFGATCKYHHPRDRHDSRPVLLNICGLPMRQDEKSCPYYMRTGSCKFGIACKFHHPQPATLGAVFPAAGPSAYGSTASAVATPASLPLIGGLSAWSLSRPSYMSNLRMQGLPPYMPVAFPPSQGTLPLQQGWSTYMGTLSHQISDSKPQAHSGSSNQLHLPERPDQPECQYYMRTGSCRYGISCKYNHPKDRNGSLAYYTLGPLGLPLRPGQAVCTFYSTYGTCKYGSACRFDHPLVGYYDYSFPAFSMPDPSTSFPNQKSVEFLPSKTPRVSDPVVKSETNCQMQDGDNVVDGNHSAQISPSHTEPSSESPKDHAYS